MAWFRKYFVAGLLVWLPIAVTLAVIVFIINIFDQSLLLLPAGYRPETLLGLSIPGFGLLLSLVVILLTGFLVANFLGNKIIELWEYFLSKIPLVRTIYTAVKQLAEAIFGSGDQTFQKVFLLEYPRKGLWTLAFQMSRARGEAQIKTGKEETVNLFVPTTPNPTSGYFIIVDISEIVELDMSVDDALKMVISGGVVVPEWNKN